MAKPLIHKPPKNAQGESLRDKILPNLVNPGLLRSYRSIAQVQASPQVLFGDEFDFRSDVRAESPERQRPVRTVPMNSSLRIGCSALPFLTG
jgi:hypothetical protein